MAPLGRVRHKTSSTMCCMRFRKKDLGDSQKELSEKEHRARLHLKRRIYRFQLKRGLAIDDHKNNYTKLLANQVNVDVAIEEENKGLILLNFLPNEEYETFVLTLINDK